MLSRLIKRQFEVSPCKQLILLICSLCYFAVFEHGEDKYRSRQFNGLLIETSWNEG